MLRSFLLSDLFLGQEISVFLVGRRLKRILGPQLRRKITVRVPERRKHGLDGVSHGTSVTCLQDSMKKIERVREQT